MTVCTERSRSRCMCNYGGFRRSRAQPTCIGPGFTHRTQTAATTATRAPSRAAVPSTARSSPSGSAAPPALRRQNMCHRCGVDAKAAGMHAEMSRSGARGAYGCCCASASRRQRPGPWGLPAAPGCARAGCSAPSLARPSPPAPIWCSSQISRRPCPALPACSPDSSGAGLRRGQGE